MFFCFRNHETIKQKIKLLNTFQSSEKKITETSYSKVIFAVFVFQFVGVLFIDEH